MNLSFLSSMSLYKCGGGWCGLWRQQRLLLSCILIVLEEEAGEEVEVVVNSVARKYLLSIRVHLSFFL